MSQGIIPTNVMPSIGYAMSAGRSLGGRMSLPVSPSMYIYSHFRHVSGVPAPEGAGGVSISKLKILDVLIERLSQIKKQGNMNPVETENISDERIDALIDQYEQQIRSYQAGAQAAGAAMSYTPMPQTSAGAVFNLVA
jgi:hypothetical protein